MFSRVSYYIAGNEIDSIDNPGIATAMKGIVSFNDDLAYHDACWRIKSSSNIISKEGYFSIFIPLKMILGFCEDYTNFIYRIHQELNLIRTNTNCNNVLLIDETIANTYTVNINLSEIIWRMPQYKFSLTYEAGIIKKISSSIEYEIFKYSYYGKERHPLIDYNDFINKYPVIVIDCSKQSEVIKGSTINIKINFQWWNSFAVDSVINCLVITSDRARYNPLKNTVVVH